MKKYEILICCMKKKYVPIWLFLLLCLVFNLSTIFELKVILLGLLIASFWWVLNEKIIITPHAIKSFVILVYSLCFLIVPYWAISDGVFEIIKSAAVLSLGFIVLLVCYGQSLSEVEIDNDRHFYIIFLVVFFVNVLLLYLALKASIPYKGDTDYLISNSNKIGSFLLNEKSWLFIVLICISGVCYFRLGSIRYMVLMLVTIILGSVIIYLRGEDSTIIEAILRYPAMFYYLLWSCSSSLLGYLGPDFFSISAYKILPLVAITFFAVIYGCNFKSNFIVAKIMLAISIVTIPSLSYYATLPYIETIVLVFTAIALLVYPDEVKSYCLDNKVGVGIIFLFLTLCAKETTIVYAIAFCLLTAWLCFSYADGSSLSGNVLKIIRFVGMTVTPLMIYLYFRHGVVARGYQFNISNYAVLENYRIVVQSYWEQFALFFPLTVIALVFLFIRKKFTIVFLNLLVLLGYTLFFMGDGVPVLKDGYVVGTGYTGYSRFNLYSLPSMLCLCLAALNELKVRKKNMVVCLLACLLIGANLSLSPYYINGNRKAGWGDYTIDTSEQIYPYKSFYQWYSMNRGARVLVLGRKFGYFDDLYTYKYNIPINNLYGVKMDSFDPIMLTALNPFNYILYHEEQFGLTKRDMANLGIIREFLSLHFREVKVFRNHTLRLILYAPREHKVSLKHLH